MRDFSCDIFLQSYVKSLLVCPPISPISSNTPRAEVEDFFKRMDRDFDGRLSFGEFMGEETPLEKVFKNMDKDGDGTVSKAVSVII